MSDQMGKRKHDSSTTSESTENKKSKVENEANTEPVPRALAFEFDSEVRPLIDVIDQLRGFGLDSDIGLPAVAVIGDQSAGKSSVLEAISGIQLPRGSGIVTRCPLEMRMKKAVTDWQAVISYTDKAGQKNRKKTEDSSSVGSLVQTAQQEMTDSENGISDQLITLEIKSPDVPDLTLIDLPGIARIAVKGQPKDIENKIKNLIRKYIKRQETIILTVVQCNVDIETCEAIKMAQEFDKKGCRTLGVLTKPDLLDPGTETKIFQVLNNEVIHLSKGYIIVKCRGQQAIDQGQSLKDALQSEAEFFRDHPHFGEIRPSQRGTQSLSRRLSEELIMHIKKLLPGLKEDVREKLLATDVKLKKLGPDPPENIMGKRHEALMMVNDFMGKLQRVIKGESCDDKQLPNEVKNLFTKVRGCFDDLYEEAEENGSDFTTPNVEWKLALQNKMIDSRGREFSNYMGKFELVESMAREYVMKIEKPAIKCFDDVHNFTTDVLKRLAETCFKKYPGFAVKAKDIIHKIRTSTQSRGREEIERYFSMEELIYSQDKTYNPSLMATGSPRQVLPVSVSPSVDKAIESLCAYYKVAKQRICDVIPMMIQLHVFKEQVKSLGEDLIDLATDERIIEEIEEDKDLAQMRLESKSKYQRLLKAEKALDKI